MEPLQVVLLVISSMIFTAVVTWIAAWMRFRSEMSSTSLIARVCGYAVWRWSSAARQWSFQAIDDHPEKSQAEGNHFHRPPNPPSYTGISNGYTVRVIYKPGDARPKATTEH
jgi:hypothetical protein